MPTQADIRVGGSQIPPNLKPQNRINIFYAGSSKEFPILRLKIISDFLPYRQFRQDFLENHMYFFSEIAIIFTNRLILMENVSKNWSPTRSC